MPERRNVWARGIYRVLKDGRLTDRAVLNEVQFRLITLLHRAGFPAYPMAFVAGPANLYMWQDDDGGLTMPMAIVAGWR